eukprot:3831430-Heterocapsa_arctica.AAC.1
MRPSPVKDARQEYQHFCARSRHAYAVHYHTEVCRRLLHEVWLRQKQHGRELRGALWDGVVDALAALGDAPPCVSQA